MCRDHAIEFACSAQQGSRLNRRDSSTKQNTLSFCTNEKWIGPHVLNDDPLARSKRSTTDRGGGMGDFAEEAEKLFGESTLGQDSQDIPIAKLNVSEVGTKDFDAGVQNLIQEIAKG